MKNYRIKRIKATKLARKLYPDLEEENGYLLKKVEITTMEDAEKEVERELVAALVASNFPANAHNLRTVAEAMLWGMKKGEDDITALDAVSCIRKELRS